jgi:hypothetical protein
MIYPNGANAFRKAIVTAAIKQLPPPSGGNRRERRTALAKVRQALTNTGALDRRNEAEKGRVLHPTRGYRVVSAKRVAVATIVDMTKKGFGMNTEDTRNAIKEAA